MLFLAKREQRVARETTAAHERMVEAVRYGTVLAHNRAALEAYQRSRAARSHAPTQTVAGYRATLARLGQLQGRRGPLGLVN